MNGSTHSSGNKTQEDFETIRNFLLDKSTEDLAHELPGLIDTISTLSIGSEETLRYVIGVSFSTQGTGFDYYIDRVFRRQATGMLVSEPVKEPIDEKHHYIEICYPPDQQFDASALRGALITTIESRLHEQVDESGRTDRRDLRSRVRAAIDVLRRGRENF